MLGLNLGSARTRIAFETNWAMFKFSHCPLSCLERQVRWGMLGLCSAFIFGAFFYNLGHKASFLACPIRHYTGIPCPTCGMTRSFMAIARGDWSQAIAEHLFGPILFLAFLITAIHVSLELLRGQQIRTFYLQIIASKRVQLLSLMVYMTYYSMRLYHSLKAGELSVAFLDSPLGHSLRF